MKKAVVMLLAYTIGIILGGLGGYLLTSTIYEHKVAELEQQAYWYNDKYNNCLWEVWQIYYHQK